MKKLLVIDSNALIHRAYHALPPLSTKDGTLTNAAYGYASTVISAINNIQPDYVAATFDLAKPTFRHKKYAEYKATREKAPDELYQQIPIVREFLEKFGIPIFEKEGFEADDVIGTIIKEVKAEKDLESVIVTGDLDTLQLVGANTQVFTLGRGINDPVVYDEDKVRQRYGLEADQMVDYKALRGDPSDNIPGVPGVGQKIATDLLARFETLKKVYENIENIDSLALKKKLKENKEKAFLSYELASIRQDALIDFDLEKCRRDRFDREELVRYMKKMEFNTLLKRIFPEGQFREEKAAHSIKILEKKEEWQNVKQEILRQKATSIFFFFDKDNRREEIGAAIKNGKKLKAYRLPPEALEDLGAILQDGSILVYGHNVKKIIRSFFTNDNLSDEIANNFFDVQIAAYLLRSGTNNELKKLVLAEFGSHFENETTRKGQANLLVDEKFTSRKEVAESAAWIFKLGEVFEAELKKISREQKKSLEQSSSLAKLMKTLENPLVSILARMEHLGVEVDREKLEAVSQKAQKKIEKLEEEIYQLAGEEFNINSPSQLADILYSKLEISTREIRRGKTGYSTDADQLRKIRNQHEIIPKIEEYRELFKLKTTYADSLPKLIDDDGRIRTNFNQAITATGRLSSSDPNLQNIPKKGELADGIREAFVAKKGFQLVSIDYSQIDLRVAAHISQDPRLIEIFQNNKDVHRTTAAWVNGIEEKKVTPKQRNEAKSLNFGVLYGMGAYGFMRDSGVSKERANFFIDQYMKSFSGLKKYLKETIEFAKEKGFVETQMGRRRYISNISSSNYQLQKAAERVAINLPIQGLAADIMKLAMAQVDEQMKKEYDLEEARMILQVHDELIFEVKDELAEEFGKKVAKAMEDVYALKVPLLTETSWGQKWSQL